MRLDDAAEQFGDWYENIYRQVDRLMICIVPDEKAQHHARRRVLCAKAADLCGHETLSDEREFTSLAFLLRALHTTSGPQLSCADWKR